MTREIPQIAGQAVLVALAQRTPGADAAAGATITRPTEREWDGSDELRTELERALGDDAGSALPDLMFAESADQFDQGKDDEAVGDEWLYVDALGSREAHRDKERFIADIVPPLIADPVTEAITGKGAFARFRS